MGKTHRGGFGIELFAMGDLALHALKEAAGIATIIYLGANCTLACAVTDGVGLPIEASCEVFPLICGHCGEPMAIISIVTGGLSIKRILEYIGEPTTRPQIALARGPPCWKNDIDQTPLYDITLAQAEPDDEFDQSISW